MHVRHQRGYVYRVGSGKRGRQASFHIRFYQTELVDGKPTRVQRSKLLCFKDDRHYSAKCDAVKKLADKFMAKINEDSGIVAANDKTVVAFWEEQYLPYCESKYKGRGMKPASVRVLKQIWQSLLKDHFGNSTLQSYQPEMARAYLSSMKTMKSRSTLRHVRSTASAIFAEAIERGLLKREVNPWHVKLPKDCRDSGPTKWYTLEEAENIISALVDRVDCQLVMALACFLGLRPGEIAGLQWGDVDADWIHIRRAVDTLGNIGTPKTDSSIGKVPLVDQGRVPLELWRKKCGGKREGWMFESSSGQPVILPNLVKRVIKPILKAAAARALEVGDAHLGESLQWKTLYAGRRCAATLAIEQGNMKLGQALLRHESLTTTLTFYDKQITDRTFREGMQQVHSKRLNS